MIAKKKQKKKLTRTRRATKLLQVPNAEVDLNINFQGKTTDKELGPEISIQTQKLKRDAKC